MEFQIDHIFIMVSKGAPEADQLIQFGLSEEKPNVHIGQGTSNRRFFFNNFMLEFVWVHNPKEAQNENTRPTFLWDRWMNRDKKSPFGICLRPVEKLESKLPFRWWEYVPAFLPNGESFFISESSKNLNEPMIFISPFVEHHDKTKKVSKLNHKEITSVRIYSPETAKNMSDALTFVSGIKNMCVKKSINHSLELGIDGQTEGKSKNFHPQLPLLIKW